MENSLGSKKRERKKKQRGNKGEKQNFKFMIIYI